MKNNWHKATIDAATVRQLSSRHGIDLLSASILTRREIIDAGEVEYFLSDDLDLLHNPYHFSEMALVIERLLQARDEIGRAHV
jgi:single-stranded-DNA-specific exonuclease